MTQASPTNRLVAWLTVELSKLRDQLSRAVVVREEALTRCRALEGRLAELRGLLGDKGPPEAPLAVPGGAVPPGVSVEVKVEVRR